MVDGVTVQVGEVTIAAEKAFAVAGRCGIDAVQFRLDELGDGDGDAAGYGQRRGQQYAAAAGAIKA